MLELALLWISGTIYFVLLTKFIISRFFYKRREENFFNPIQNKKP